MDISPPTNSESREWKLVLAGSSFGASAAERMRPLLGKPIEWKSVIRLADQHGTTSLLYQNLFAMECLVPSEAFAVLRQKYESNVHKSLLLARELMRILDCLDGLGIESLPYKGLVLSEIYYGDMALRQSGDMDLLVRRVDVPRIESRVRDLGYTPRASIPASAETAYIASGYEYSFDSTAGQNLLEVQWALQPRFYAVDFGMDGLFERAVSVRVAGRSLRTLCPEDLLIVLSVHAAKHVWGRLIWLSDIAQILKRVQLDWDSIQARSRALGIERILHITLLLAKRFLECAIPVTIENAIRADRAAQVLAEQIATAVAAGVSYEEEKLSYFRLMIKLRERRADRMRFLMRLTFTPGPGEWKTIRLPKFAAPLYRIVRLARLASRFAR